MALSIEKLADYAANLTYGDIPGDVLHRAQDCILDTVGVAVFGSALPWSRMIADYARRTGGNGRCTLLGSEERLSTPAAALANGAQAHAFELDNLRFPGAGVHPGATVAMPALAMAEDLGASGRDLLTAVVAGCEVMMRIGAASLHTSEKLGFHAPGLTGPFGSAIACGRLLGLSAAQMMNAMGIAGSLSSGLLEFAKSGSGGMVKRLHLGRAAESGVLAASLAREGFDGPQSVLEGEYGFLNVYCQESDPALLTNGLGLEFETLRICLKRYACHVTAQTPVQSVRELMAAHDFSGGDVASLTVFGGDKLVSHHNIPEPGDMMLAQYSVPFCVALALFRDPDDPANFSENARNDPAIREMARRIEVSVQEESNHPGMGWATTVRVSLRDGRRFTRVAESFKGTPNTPLSPVDLEAKFRRLTEPALGKEESLVLYETFSRLEHVATLRAESDQT